MNDNKAKAIFNALIAEKEQIEAEFGCELDWQFLDDRIALYHDGADIHSKSSWKEINLKLAESVANFKKVFRERLKALS